MNKDILNELKKNKTYMLVGHKLKITDVLPHDRLQLDCYGHCCTAPLGMSLECTLEDLQNLEQCRIRC